MKKLLAALIVVALLATAVVALVACDPDYVDVAEAIAAAQEMTEEELVEAAKAEMAKYKKDTFTANSLTSGIQKALAGFMEKYDWVRGEYVSRKGAEFQEVLNAAADTGNGKVGDFVMIQDASFVYSLFNAGFLHSYVPTGEGYNIASADQNPLVGVTFNKIWYYNSKNGSEYLQNVWQLTGEDGQSLQKLEKVSFQSPLKEDINMSFLIMLTSPAYASKLESAYQSYFGEAYTKKDNCASIGHHFVEQFLSKGVTTWHSSDTDEVKKINDTNHQTGVYFAGLAKVKDYNNETKITDTQDPGYWKNIMKASGYNYNVEGFDGFVYNMWTLIPDTAHLPYTACLFIRYILSEEGYKKGFNEVGYYSANTLVPSADGTQLSSWKATCLAEDPTYLADNYVTVSEFVRQYYNAAQK